MRPARLALRAAVAVVTAAALLTGCTVATWNDAAADYCITRLQNPGRSLPRLPEFTLKDCDRLYTERNLPGARAVMIVSEGSLYFVPHGVQLVSRGTHRLQDGRIVSATSFSEYAARVSIPADMGHLVDVEAEPGGLLLVGWDKDYRVALSGAGRALKAGPPVAAPGLERDRSIRKLDDYSCNDLDAMFPDAERGVLFVARHAALYATPLGRPFVVERRRLLTSGEMNSWSEEPLGVLADADFRAGVDHLVPLRGEAYFVDGGLDANAAVRLERVGAGWRFSEPMRVPRPIRLECVPRGLIGLARERLQGG